MKLGLPIVAAAAVAWIILYLIIGIPLWIAFVVAGGIIVLGTLSGTARMAR